MMKSMCSALLVVLCCLPVVGSAAVCRSGQAASVGSQTAYEQAKNASDIWAERERTVSDELQDCLSRIRTTRISLPSFPSLEDLLNKVADQICQAAVDKVNSHIPASFDPWSQGGLP
ncbi:conjugal transfer protein [Pseudomonas sp. MAG002Y]|uniref:conjugal transfer protein n=1 Tax=Pseudomonas sp. MAG002Y TaxID=2678690 RepID=UPI001C60A475|nr:conjugal transfer protein [Pseudomonas sp. MAG002Y]MBW5416266.1 conjugal transfer protein [Pseudomonas sp. MAG002Y]